MIKNCVQSSLEKSLVAGSVMCLGHRLEHMCMTKCYRLIYWHVTRDFAEHWL